MPRALAGLVLAFILTTAVAPPGPALAMPQGMVMYHHTSYRGAPNLHLTLAVVIAGGGPSHFQAAKLVGVLGGTMTKAEVAKLTRQYGAANVQSFLATFTFAVDDALRLVKEFRIPLPARPVPNPQDGGKMTAALVHAGTMPNGTYDVGYMLERLISHDFHVIVMRDINQNPQFGPRVNANFHIILSRAILDLKAAYGL